MTVYHILVPRYCTRRCNSQVRLYLRATSHMSTVYLRDFGLADARPCHPCPAHYLQAGPLDWVARWACERWVCVYLNAGTAGLASCHWRRASELSSPKALELRPVGGHRMWKSASLAGCSRPPVVPAQRKLFLTLTQMQQQRRREIVGGNLVDSTSPI